MTLFFETGRQAGSFLAALPIGFMVALCLCCGRIDGMWRLAADLLLLLSGGIGLVLLTVIARENSLRMYHVLGALCGAFLYLRGLDAAGKVLARRLQKERKSKNKTMQAGISSLENENI